MEQLYHRKCFQKPRLRVDLYCHGRFRTIVEEIVNNWNKLDWELDNWIKHAPKNDSLCCLSDLFCLRFKSNLETIIPRGSIMAVPIPNVRADYSGDFSFVC